MYNIFTVANEAYFPFLEIFINSINKNSPKVNNIFVLDTGLGRYSSYIESLQKVKLIKGDIRIQDFSGVHSSSWYETTGQKTKYVLSLLEDRVYAENFIPTIMIDNDVYVDKELLPLIDTQFDIQVTTMEEKNQHFRKDGIKLSEIACFICFNKLEKSKIFVNEWIYLIQNLQKLNVDKPHETPAMNLLIQKAKEFFKIKFMQESIVCSDMEFFDYSYCLHFKSVGTNNNNKVQNFTSRISSFKNFSKYFNPLDFLNKELFENWKIS